MSDWTDPDTHLALPRSGTPRDVDGLKPGEPLGLVVCEHCWRAARHQDWISHGPDCPLADGD
jgi:hypothetical protein